MHAGRIERNRRRRSSTIAALGWCALALCISQPSWGTQDSGSAQSGPTRIRRADAFLGIHFDFHAGPNATEVGKGTTVPMIEGIIAQVKPDYIQVDCKGHKGLSSYPTLVGNRAPGFVGDPLQVWREVTARAGVGLYMHYSGLWDSAAAKAHPGWALVQANGQPSGDFVSVYGDYTRSLMIPQLRELAGKYKVDGAWVDADAWAVQPDYCAAAKAEFTAATGLQDMPSAAGQPGWAKMMELQRRAFGAYLDLYTRELRRTHPDFELCSNWAGSELMPGPAPAGVSWLSGDLSPENSVNAARLSARYFAQQGRPWDLMSWSFVRTPARDGRWLKSAVQLQREAAVVLTQGGGYQMYFRQRRDGGIFPEHMPMAGQVARFCRERQALCQGARPVPQIALLHSTTGFQARSSGLFQRAQRPVDGVLQALLEANQVVDVVGEHHVRGGLARWPLLVVPEWDELSAEFRRELLAHVRSGGRVLLVGPGPVRQFAHEVGAWLPEKDSDASLYRLEAKPNTVPLQGRLMEVRLTHAKEFGGHLLAPSPSLPNAPLPPAASMRRLGAGHLAALYYDAGSSYAGLRDPNLRRAILAAIQELFPEPLVSIDGNPALDVCLTTKAGALAVHLVNVGGQHATQDLIDVIEPVGKVTLRLRTKTAPRAVTLQPEGAKLDWRMEDGRVVVTVPSVAIHAALVVE